MARELILKLGEMITDRPEIMLGGHLTENDPEYKGLSEVVTDEQAEIALAMGRRKPTTVAKLAKKMGKSEAYIQEQFDAMSKLGLLEYDWETPDRHKQWFVPHFIVGCGEYMALHQCIEEEFKPYDESGRVELFERSTFLPLTKIIHMIPPGGAGIGMHVVPVQTAVPMQTATPDAESIIKLLDRYDGVYAVAPCICRMTQARHDEATGEIEEEVCLAMGDAAKYVIETGLGHAIDRREVEATLKRCEDNGYVHQINLVDGDEKISFICNCHIGTCMALRTSQLFNTPNLSASAYRAHVDPEKCVACGKCAEICPAGAAKLGQKLCTKSGPVVYPKARTGNDHMKWTEADWNKNYRDDNQKVCHESGTSPCKAACPAHIAVQGYINLAAQGRYDEALKLIKQDNPFPAICGSICNRRCEDACMRGSIGEPVAIDEIKKFIAEQELSEKNRYIPQVRYRKGSAEPNHEKIAIIGAGPAGMSCAYFLASWGYDNITVFDKNKAPGGMLTYGIPSFRLDKKVVSAEIDVLKKMGVKFKCGVEVGRDITIDQLRKQGYMGFYVAVGAQKSAKLGISGEELTGVLGGIDFLREVNLGNELKLGKKVAVIGGGNVAMDVARTAVRMGADVTVVYRRKEENMPADPEEVAEAKAEGVKFVFENKPVEILGKDGKVSGLRTDKGEYKCSNVIAAIGQQIDWGELDTGAMEKGEKGQAAIVDARSFQTAQPDIFVGGDCFTGPKFAIDAIAAGREGAESLHRFVHRGHSLTLSRDYHEYFELDKNGVVLGIESFDAPERATVKHDAKKAKTMKNDRVTLTEEEVKKEASRCLGCGISVVDRDKCIGCGLCTTKCMFDAIRLMRDNPECTRMINIDEQMKAIIPYIAKKGTKIAIKSIKEKLGI